MDVLHRRSRDARSAVSKTWFAGINFLHFAALLFGLCSVILIVVSVLTGECPDTAARVKLRYGSHAPDRDLDGRP